jgi:hypothetical protein
MNLTFKTGALATPLLLLAACATLPNGPSVMALPGTGKTFDQFRADDFECRQYAGNSLGGTSPGDAQAESVVKSAAVGTAIGALAGAIIGGHRGAGAGAGTGLLAGSLMGASAGNSSGYGAQQRYDNAYVQCMYAKGDQVPTNGQVRSSGRRYAAPAYNVPPPAAPAYNVPPPPPAAGYEMAPPPPPAPR